MNKRLLWYGLVILLSFNSSAIAQTDNSSNLQALSKSLVRINVVGTTARDESVDQTGTGFFISEDGYIATAAHILDRRVDTGAPIEWQEDVSGNVVRRKISLEHLNHRNIFEPLNVTATRVPLGLGTGLDVAVLKVSGSGYVPAPCSMRRVPTDHVLRGLAARAKRDTFDPLEPGHVAVPDVSDGLRYRIVGMGVRRGNSGGPVFDPLTGTVLGIITSGNPNRLIAGPNETFATPLYALSGSFPFNTSCESGQATREESPMEGDFTWNPPNLPGANNPEITARVVTNELKIPPGRYKISGKLQIAEGGTLVLSSGVSIIFEGKGSIEVFGRIIAVGTQNKPIRLIGESIVEPRLGLDFKSRDLDLSKLAWISFERGAGLRLSKRSKQHRRHESKLYLNKVFFRDSQLIGGKESEFLSLEIRNASFRNTRITLSYPHAPRMTITNSSIVTSTLDIQSYSRNGVSIDSSTLDRSEFKLGCCSAKFDLVRSVIKGLKVGAGDGSPVNGTVTINNSIVQGYDIELPSAMLKINETRFDQIFDWRYKTITIGGLAATDSCFTGQARGAALTITGRRGRDANRAQLVLDNLLFSDFATGVEMRGGRSVTITSIGFDNVPGVLLANRSTLKPVIRNLYGPFQDKLSYRSRMVDRRNDASWGEVKIVQISNRFENPVCRLKSHSQARPLDDDKPTKSKESRRNDQSISVESLNIDSNGNDNKIIGIQAN